MSLQDHQRIVVTGIGLVTPLGADRETSWKNLLDGRSGVADDRARAPVPAGDGPRAADLALLAAREALAQSGHPFSGPGERWGCALSCSKPLLEGAGPGVRALPPETVPQAAARAHHIGGPVVNFSSACATGLQSVMAAAEWVREGRCDFVLAGASESSLHPLYLSGFSQMGVLSPDHRVRPFDRRRNGFVIGEGAAAFVVESLASARRRGAPVLGELLGWDFACDASHATRFNSDGRKIARSLARALERAGLSPADVDYVNAHGTATLLNDRLEALALESLFRGARRPKVSSTKGATGHLLGATGAVELAFCLLGLRDRRLPPTLHLEDPETDGLDFLPGRSRDWDARTAAALSFGFGGSIASLAAGRSS